VAPKRVVSVSLGSSKRDHRVEVTFLGQPFEISRRGTDGDMEKAIAVLKELDGKVDAIGLGGIDVYLYIGPKRFVIQDALKLLEAVKVTPVVDGSGLKNTLEREVVRYLARKTDLIPPGTKVLMVSAADRFGMAEAFAEAGCDVTFGDLIFTMGVPHPIRTLAELEQLANKLLPEICKMPFHMIYPTGKKQETVDEAKAAKFAPFFEEARVIAGDFHMIRRFLPARLAGQTIVTNTTTPADVELLRERGAGCLVTTTPELDGRSFGTNVMEGVLVALLDKPVSEITPDDYLDLLRRLEFEPRIRKLN